MKSDTERKRKLLVIIFPDWSKFYQTSHDLDMNLEAMDANIKVANINREIHKVSPQPVVLDIDSKVDELEIRASHRSNPELTLCCFFWFFSAK